MKAYHKNGIGRRDFLQTFGAAAGIAAIGGPSFAGQARTGSETTDEKRKARYKAESADIRTYYRVNRYPD